MISSRTPEGWFGRCEVCGHEGRVEPSSPTCDAPCPECGSLNWYDPSSRPSTPDPFLSPVEDVLGDSPDEWALPGDDLEVAFEEWEAAGRPKWVVVDFQGVPFIDSAHLGRLIRLHTRLLGLGGRLRLRGLSDDVRRVFGLTCLDRLLDCDD